MEEKRALPKVGRNISPSLALSEGPGGNQGIHELSQKMLSWSDLWFGSAGSGESTEERERVRERLLYWLKRCIGREASNVLTSQVEDVSLASSAPLLTAFLGRRAVVELSRRVLNDS